MTGLAEAIEAAAAVLGGLAQRGAPLGPRTTYRVGGPAALLVEAGSPGDLDRVATAVRASGLEALVVGKGSNLLVADAGVDGLVLRLGAAFEEIAIEGTTVRAGGAAALPVVARRTASAGLTGFEWAVGVPGSIGGAVRMNAGGHGSDMSATLLRVRLLDLATGDDGVVPVADLDLAYRSSAVTPSRLVAWAELGLAEGDAEASLAEISEIVRWRREHQPGGQNAGSVFTNPDGDSAGRLVDASGCKGLRLGTAHVSEKHANFIQADPGGSADDVHALVHEVRRRVREATGVDLHPELRLIGFDPNPEPEVEG